MCQIGVCPVCYDKVFVADSSCPVHLLQILQNSVFVVSVQRIFEEHGILTADIGAVEGQPDIKIDTFKMRDGEIASAGRHAQQDPVCLQLL